MVRLITQYTTGSVLCLSQATFEVNANADALVLMFVPPGKTIKRITTFGRLLVPAGKNWVQCDDLTSPPASGTLGSPCPGMVLHFNYNASLNDSSDHSQGWNIVCASKWVNGDITTASRDRLGCRVQFQY